MPVLSLPRFFTSAQRRHAIDACGAVATFSGVAAHHLVHLSPRPGRAAGRNRADHVHFGLDRQRRKASASRRSTCSAVGARRWSTAVGARTCRPAPCAAAAGNPAGNRGGLLRHDAGRAAPMSARRRRARAWPIRSGRISRCSLRRIAEWQITSLILVPEYLAGLVAAMEASGERLPLLTLVAVGGARTPPALLERARAVGPAGAAGLRPDRMRFGGDAGSDAATSAGSVGRPLGRTCACASRPMAK